MAGKKMEGSEEQRRRRAREAREAGRTASEDGATQGASRQRKKLDADARHREKIETIRQGKQDIITENTPEPRPGYAGEDD